MNKLYALIFILFITSWFQCKVDAQQGTQNKLSPVDYKPSLIELKKNFPRLYGFKNTEVCFIDERDDTTRMGFVLANSTQYYFAFPKPTALYLSQKLNILQRNKQVDTLYIGIKRLWISQVQISATLVRSLLLSPYSAIGYCRIICNFYKRTGNNYLLVHVYDSVVSKKGYLGNTSYDLLEENLSGLSHIADSICNIKNLLIIPGKIFPSFKPVHPFILSSKKLNDGIYLQFDNFLNNNPIPLDFIYSESNNRGKIILRDMKMSDTIYTERCWGFCKDGIPYMKVGLEFSKLTRIQNTFELRALESLQYKHRSTVDAFWLGFNLGSDIKQKLPLLFSLDITDQIKSTNTIKHIVPFKLDMETGEVY